MELGDFYKDSKESIMNIDKVKDIVYVIMDKGVDIALIAAIVYLASNGMEGWGWLILILLIKQ
jgi:hypothetical protein